MNTPYFLGVKMKISNFSPHLAIYLANNRIKMQFCTDEKKRIDSTSSTIIAR